MMSANDEQIGGSHYKQKPGVQEHWDRVWALGLDYWQACITKYVERCWKKNGIQDLQKARHFLDKYIELNQPVMGGEGEQLDLSSAANMASSMKGIKVVKLRVSCAQCDDTGCPECAPDWAKHQAPSQTHTFTPGQVLPTGWAQFVFEGVDAGGSFFTCKECKSKFHTPVGENPHAYHTCHGLVDEIEDALRAADASRAYVNQG